MSIVKDEGSNLNAMTNVLNLLWVVNIFGWKKGSKELVLVIFFKGMSIWHDR